jgi:Glycosyl transferase family 2
MNRRVRADREVRVSAILPFFNHGMVVDDALASIRRQSRPVDQIIVVDDGSTDPFSVSVLRRLEGEGVTVVQQENQGPGAARNLGVARADGDAIFFLDSDDVVTEHHVERALGALVDAPDEVGFVYPDMQFMGNEHHLVIMPPYNFYLLLHRNFCCMGGLIDAGVFNAGFRFRSDRLVGHEDWDFFVQLGLGGIFGRPVHGAPLGYRRWGYSRSDGVVESRSGLGHMRELHPVLDQEGRLVEIKREWAPALSVVVPPNVGEAMADQTCADFEIVVRAGDQPPPTRGRWVLMVSPAGVDVLNDGTFVERVLRLVGGQTPSAPVVLSRLEEPATGWRRLTGAIGAPLGLVAEGHFYLDWARGATAGASDLEAFRNYFTVTARPTETWGYAQPPLERSAARLVELRPPRRPPPPPVGPVETSGSEVERAFRHHEALPLFMPADGVSRRPRPPGPTDDGLGAILERAWASWMPPRSVQLTLVVDLSGRGTLEVGAGPTSAVVAATTRGPARIPIGWLWGQPFPGTECLFARRDASWPAPEYHVAADAPSGTSDAVLGYAPVDALPGRMALRRAMEDGARSVQGPAQITLPVLSETSSGVFVESIGVSSVEVAPPPTPVADEAPSPAASPHAGDSRWKGRRRRPS